MSYDPADPIDNVITAVNNLAAIAARTNSAYSHAQKNSMAYVILGKTGLNQQGLCKWLQSPLDIRTWEHSQIHFRNAHNLLRVTTEGTLRDSRFQQANMIQEVVAGVTEHLLSAPENTVSLPHNPPPPYQAANAVKQQNDLLPALIQQMAQMQSMMLDIQRTMQHSTS